VLSADLRKAGFETVFLVTTEEALISESTEKF